jgi:uncharacterized membrane protein YqjE
MSAEGSPILDGLKAALLTLRSLGAAASSLIESRTDMLIEFERREIARAVRIFALSMAAVVFVCAATGFAALAILFAAGEAHRVAAAVGIAAAFGVLALLAIRLTGAK